MQHCTTIDSHANFHLMERPKIARQFRFIPDLVSDDFSCWPLAMTFPANHFLKHTKKNVFFPLIRSMTRLHTQRQRKKTTFLKSICSHTRRSAVVRLVVNTQPSFSPSAKISNFSSGPMARSQVVRDNAGNRHSIISSLHSPQVLPVGRATHFFFAIATLKVDFRRYFTHRKQHPNRIRV